MLTLCPLVYIITVPVFLCEGKNCRLDVVKLPEDGASRAWILHVQLIGSGHMFFLSFALIGEERIWFLHITRVQTLLKDYSYFDGKLSWGIRFVAAVCLLSEGGKALPHTHPLFSVCSGEITPFTDTWSSRYHVLVFADTLLCTFPSQSAHPVREESVCLNLLFVMQVISEEGVSFKVSLFSHYLSFPPLLSVARSCLYLSKCSSFCDVIPWWFCLWLFVLYCMYFCQLLSDSPSQPLLHLSFDDGSDRHSHI